MTSIATDQLTDGKLIELPAEAGDITAPRFEPNEEWLQRAPALEQKTAVWRWFATRYEELEPSTPHDPQGNYFFGRKEPVQLDQVLHERFDALVPQDRLDELVKDIQARAGNEWAWMELDKLSS